MNRSLLMALCLGLVATPALAQQPLPPQPLPPQSLPQQQYDPNAQMQAPPEQQPIDPYGQYGDLDDEDDSMDVTYDISTDPEEQQYDDGYDANAYQQFESELAPYGAWQDVPDYGRVWVPSPSVVGYDFTPYGSGGNWVDSEYGWTWNSDYDWGWAPFHYGRWMVMGGRGWCWIPGTTWGPAWVNWRWGGGYVGWAPMGPRGVVIGPPRGVRSPWRFTVAGQLASRRPHFLPSRAVASVWHATSPIHNVSNVSIRGTQVRFNAGPPLRLVAAATGHTISPVPLRTVAPRALPSQSIAPRVGMPLQQRPWMQGRSRVGTTIARSGSLPATRTLGSQSYVARQPTTLQARPGTVSQSRPMPLQYRAPTQQPYRYAQPAYRAAPQPVHYATPAQSYHYAAPAQSYHYAAPAQSYHYATPAQSYHYAAPAQSYHAAPMAHYATPVQSYQAAPAYHYAAPMQSAPSFQSSPSPAAHYSAPAPSFHSAAPSYGGGFHGGGGGGFHGGGRR
jgi:hypothetical protein